MWPLPVTTALDLAHQRMRELGTEAARARLAAEARTAGRSATGARPNVARLAVARAFRALSDATHAVSLAACTAATRLEGRIA
jgi:hypothetical protein